MCARILAVADALDKFITEAPKKENSVMYALKKLDEEADVKYEKVIVDVVIKLHAEIENLVKQFELRESILGEEI